MKRYLTLSLAAISLTACAHHVTVPKTTPDLKIGHERTAQAERDRIFLLCLLAYHDQERLTVNASAGATLCERIL